MKVISSPGRINIKKPVVVLGVFDGVHRGHQALIKRAVRRAKTLKTKTVVVTFNPHPVQVLYPERKLELIVPFQFRLQLLEQLGVDCIVVIKFTKTFSHLSPEKFVRQYLVKNFKPREVFVGDDFRFGQNRSGSVDDFVSAGKQFGFKVNHVTPVLIHKEKISSSYIRQLILDGDLGKASGLLGRRVSVTGNVVLGASRGKALGFPTANLVPLNEIIPPMGVYAVYVILGTKKFKGVANIGVRPTFDHLVQPNVEVHIFNFNQSIYGQTILIEFVKKIRAERKFDNARQLVFQIKKDIASSLKALSP